MVEVKAAQRTSLSPAYLGDRTLVREMAARGQVPVEELPRITADHKAEKVRQAQLEKVQRAHQVAEVVNGKGYRFT